MLTDDSSTQQPSSEIPSPSFNLSQPLKRFAIKSFNVILEEHADPIEAIILIDDGKIMDTIIPKDMDSTALENLYEDWEVIDYENLFIFPGLIDSNVHLHADFNKEWENIAYCTELAASGGVTTIVDNPVMSKPLDSADDCVKSFEDRVERIRSNSRVDFGVFGSLEPKTQEYAAKLMDAGAMGLKCFLLDCFQYTVGHFETNSFQALMEDLGRKCPDLLLLVHPEMATERELYMTSPCRPAPLKRRLDLGYGIKSIEFGGAANKGSYIEELCRKKNDDDEEDEEAECSIENLDSPTKLKSRVKKTMEKTEINDLVHFELLSYSYDGPNLAPDTIKNGDSSSESDEEEFEKVSKNESQKSLVWTEVLDKCTEVQEEADEEAESAVRIGFGKKRSILVVRETEKEEQKEVESPVNSDEQKNEPKPNTSPIKMSLFAKSHLEDQTKKVTKSMGSVFPNQEQSNEQKEEPETKVKREEQPESQQTNAKSENNLQTTLKPIKALKAINPSPLSQDQSTAVSMSPFTDIGSANSGPHAGFMGGRMTLLKSMGANPAKDKPKQVSFGQKKSLTQARKFLQTLTASDIKPLQTQNTNGVDSPSTAATITESKPQLNQAASLPGASESSVASFEDNSSPIFSARQVGSGGSSLLQRRISLKSTIQIESSLTSIMSSPGNNFRKVNSLEIGKTPDNLAKDEAKFNQSYRTFLANRPQSWEENAVSLVLNSIKPHTELRVMLQNLSLASSFLKIRQKKKINQTVASKLFCDTSASYLFFNEKMVGNGETKYKVSPPFRNRDNRRLLVENLRLGGLDTLSSYHFFVPTQYKQIDNGNFRRAFGGLENMGCSLQAAWTALYSYQQKNNKNFSEEPLFRKKTINIILRQLYKTMCANPAQVLKIGHRKGAIAKGRDADFVVWDPNSAESYNQLDKNHVFSGRTLMGVVHKTYLRGNLIYNKENPERVSKECSAEFLKPRTVVNV